MTLSIPRVPPAPGFKFEGVKEHKTRQALAAEIKETIEALIKSTYVPSWQGMFYGFMNCIEPGSVRNLSRLPYQAAGPNDTAGTKIGCVYAGLSWVIQLYWDQCLDGKDNTAQIRQHLADLRIPVACGIDRCKLCGSPRTGYWLSVE
jgi:hypothetical protein